MGLSQPGVSRLLRGDFRECSLERLFRLLKALGRDIDIVIRQPRSPRRRTAAYRRRLTVSASRPAPRRANALNCPWPTCTQSPAVLMEKSLTVTIDASTWPKGRPRFPSAFHRTPANATSTSLHMCIATHRARPSAV